MRIIIEMDDQVKMPLIQSEMGAMETSSSDVLDGGPPAEALFQSMGSFMADSSSSPESDEAIDAGPLPDYLIPVIESVISSQSSPEDQKDTGPAPMGDE